MLQADKAGSFSLCGNAVLQVTVTYLEQIGIVRLIFVCPHSISQAFEPLLETGHLAASELVDLCHL